MIIIVQYIQLYPASIFIIFLSSSKARHAFSCSCVSKSSFSYCKDLTGSSYSQVAFKIPCLCPLLSLLHNIRTIEPVLFLLSQWQIRLFHTIFDMLISKTQYLHNEHVFSPFLQAKHHELLLLSCIMRLNKVIVTQFFIFLIEFVVLKPSFCFCLQLCLCFLSLFCQFLDYTIISAYNIPLVLQVSEKSHKFSHCACRRTTILIKYDSLSFLNTVFDSALHFYTITLRSFTLFYIFVLIAFNQSMRTQCFSCSPAFLSVIKFDIVFMLSGSAYVERCEEISSIVIFFSCVLRSDILLLGLIIQLLGKFRESPQANT